MEALSRLRDRERHEARAIRQPDLCPLLRLAPTLKPLFRQVLETGVPLLDQEVMGETPEAPGVQRHWLASYYRVPDVDGTPLGLGGEHVNLEVHNKGPPIPADQLPHLFEPFRRAVEQEGLPREGLGLGLFIVKEIVAAHAGSLEVRSTQAEGTTFRVRLPRHGAREGLTPSG